MINYELGLLIAISAFVYTNLLMESNALLGNFYNKAHDFFKNDERQNKGKPLHPLFMILVHCEKCVAGQLALWIFIYTRHEIYFENIFENLLQHVFFITYCILLSGTISGIYYKITKQND